MGQIIMVSKTESFIAMSLKQQLEELGHRTVHTGTEISQLERVIGEAQLLILYMDDEAGMEKNLLVYIRDRVIDKDIPVVLMGRQDEIDDVEDVIARQFVKKEYLRPINVTETAQDIHEYLKQDDSSRKKKILVVDDSGTVLRSVKSWLEDKYQVILANSGTAAIKYLTMKRPDLVLLDYEMPVCDGKQVLEMIRSDADFSDIPVMFLTGKNDKDTVMQVTALKPAGYLLKSQNPVQIIKAIDDFFEQKKLEAFRR